MCLWYESMTKTKKKKKKKSAVALQKMADLYLRFFNRENIFLAFKLNTKLTFTVFTEIVLLYIKKHV